MKPLVRCPVCGNILKDENQDGIRQVYSLGCGFCGTYSITDQAVDEIRSERKLRAQSRLISGALRAFSDSKKPFYLRTDNIDDLIQAARPPRLPEDAVDQILVLVRGRTEYYGEYAAIQPEDIAVTYSPNFKELENYLRLAATLGYLDGPVASREYSLTAAGWRRLAEIGRATPDGNAAFVAMWFKDDLKPAWTEGFMPALAEAGYSPIRVDLIQHNGKIDDRIIAEIRKAAILIADFTGNRGGVYFEAGFALGIGVPVIWTCQSRYIKRVHFDTRQYNHLVWDEPSDLKAKLLNRIQATIVQKYS